MRIFSTQSDSDISQMINVCNKKTTKIWQNYISRRLMMYNDHDCVIQY